MSGWSWADLNFAIVGSRRQHLAVPAETEAQHSSLHQHEVVLGRAEKVGWKEQMHIEL